MNHRKSLLSATALAWGLSAFVTTSLAQGDPQKPWLYKFLPADIRANLLAAALTPSQANGFLNSVFSPTAHATGTVTGVPALGIPDIQESDASIGIRDMVPHTVLPSSAAVTATFDPAAATAGGQMVGYEGHQDQISQLFGPGGDLVRDPRGGRTFEYLGEDPALGGAMMAAYTRGLQSEGVIATVKHFAVNDYETARMDNNAIISERALRESDLLLFELGIEGGQPGSVMCSYNLINSIYACQNNHLMNDILKSDWKFKGFVLTDYFANQTVLSANDGLDQESAEGLFGVPYFTASLQQAVADGTVPVARYNDMIHRVLRTYFAKGVIDNPPVAGSFDATADAGVAQAAEEEGIVLLKNGSGSQPAVLPFSKSTPSIVVIGSHANAGVLEGGGSAQVNPIGGNAVPTSAFVWDPSPPLAAIRAEAPGATVTYVDGSDPVAAATAAAKASVAIVFVNQHSAEGSDLSGLGLPIDSDTKVDQNALVTAVAAANPNTVVVAETSTAFTMPWLSSVASVVETWYPGSGGGPAIARTLFGDVNPSGHLPLTFPQNVAQLPRPSIPGFGVAPPPRGTPTPQVDVNFNIEGQNVGYKWFDMTGQAPLFPFGYGLSYTSFAYSNEQPRLAFSASGLAVSAPLTVAVTITVANTGSSTGTAVPQLYIGVPQGLGEAPKRLGAFARVTLRPGDQRAVTMKVDPRLLAEYDPASDDWHVVGGAYRLSVGDNEASTPLSVSLSLPDLRFSAKHLF